jgi:hypothetical protein
MNTGDDAHTMRDYLNSLWMHGDTGDEWHTHECLSEGAARYGRRVLVWDDLGFDDVVTYPTVDDAAAFMAELAESYYGPDDDDDGPDVFHDDDDEYPRGAAIRAAGFAGFALRVREASADYLRVVMVGDDRVHTIARDDAELLAEGDYCASCGQIGCAWGHALAGDDDGPDDDARPRATRRAF